MQARTKQVSQNVKKNVALVGFDMMYVMRQLSSIQFSPNSVLEA